MCKFSHLTIPISINVSGTEIRLRWWSKLYANTCIAYLYSHIYAYNLFTDACSPVCIAWCELVRWCVNRIYTYMMRCLQVTLTQCLWARNASPHHAIKPLGTGSTPLVIRDQLRRPTPIWRRWCVACFSNSRGARRIEWVSGGALDFGQGIYCFEGQPHHHHHSHNGGIMRARRTWHVWIMCKQRGSRFYSATPRRHTYKYVIGSPDAVI